ncbi:MAG: hypothetical protein B6D56_01545 [Candidatus Omnitrophica bacterium 4484_70.1]|nr:MAG: hypothetical protein B6D56_01545 [Candidatus Omnitrophica bacterium 4484_70.1]
MLKKIFITGLAGLIPIVITIYVVIGLFHFADRILGNFINKYLQEWLGYSVPGLGIIISILIVFIVGVIGLISRMRVTRFLERFILKFPVVNKIYLPVKRTVDFLFFQQSNLKKAVLVEYPRKGIYSLGFLTNEAGNDFQDILGRKLYSIFIPSSPSPLTGFTIVVPQEEVIFLDIGIEKAIRWIVSGGMVNPTDFEKSEGKLSFR